MYLKRSLLFTVLVSGWILAQSGVTTPKAAAPKKAAEPKRQAPAAPPTATAAASVGPESAAAFKQHVTPILTNVCSQCHNDRVSSGGLSVASLTDPKTVQQNRDTWELILRQVRGGEMPPRGLPRPPAAQLDAFVKHIEDAFEQDDRLRQARSWPRHRTPPEP